VKPGEPGIGVVFGSLLPAMDATEPDDAVHLIHPGRSTVRRIAESVDEGAATPMEVVYEMTTS
jgi:hypothetical protein